MAAMEALDLCRRILGGSTDPAQADFRSFGEGGEQKRRQILCRHSTVVVGTPLPRVRRGNWVTVRHR